MYPIINANCRKKKLKNSETTSQKKDSWPRIFYFLHSNYGLSDDEILDLSLRQINYKVIGYNESFKIDDDSQKVSRSFSKDEIDEIMDGIYGQ